MESNNRRKRLCVYVSQSAWNRLQDHSLKVVDRHAMNVAGDIMEEQLMKLELPPEYSVEQEFAEWTEGKS